MLALSLIIIHIGLVYVYYRTRNELLNLKASYNREKSQLQINNALFSSEMSLTKEEITNTVNNLVEFKQLVEAKDKEYQNLNSYLIRATQNLEGRPEEIRREFIKKFKEHLREVNKSNQEVKSKLNILTDEVNGLTKYVYNEIPNIKRKVGSNPTRRNY
jgi:uncharacterized protein YoxC